MSYFSLTLVLQIKTSKIINDMAKVQHKSEKISAFGGIFFVLDKFDSILSSEMTGGTGTCHTSDFVFATCVKSIFQDITFSVFAYDINK